MKKCGGCTLCCEIVPVKEIEVRSFQGCPHRTTFAHACGAGCGIYARRPGSCRTWDCGWLLSPELGEDTRPDRVGFVVDQWKDLVRVNEVDTAAAQIWVAPGHEEDWRTSVHAASVIRALLDQVGAVLWRIPPGTHARGFALEEDGNIAYTELRAYETDDGVLGDEVERNERLNKLLKGKRR